MTTLVVVRTGWQQAQRMFAFRTFTARGWRVAVVDQMLNQSLRVADVPVVCDLSAIPQAVEALRARAGRPDGIVTFSDTGLIAAARIADAFDLPFLPVEVARRAIDKREQRRACAAAGLPVPDWRVVTDQEGARTAVRDWGRTVIKPADRAASVAVQLVDSADDAARAFEEAAHASRRGGAVLAERYLPGPEVSVESIAVDGRQRAICMTEKVNTHGPHFVEIGQSVPCALEPELRESVVAVALSACTALGLDWGACHTEVKLTEAGPVIVEVNPRLPGDCVPDLIHMAIGLNAYELLGRQALGEALTLEDLAPRRQRGAAIHFRLNSPGTFLGASSPLEAEPPDWLVELSVTTLPGHRLEAATSNSDRLGYAICTGDSAHEAAARARSAMDTVTVRLAPEPAPAALETGVRPTGG
jgi:S-sulfo-L-cysteine synthase (3-phospho-L-serine-dependent)